MTFLWDKSQAIPLPSGNFGEIEIQNNEKIWASLKVFQLLVDDIPLIQNVKSSHIGFL